MSDEGRVPQVGSVWYADGRFITVTQVRRKGRGHTVVFDEEASYGEVIRTELSARRFAELVKAMTSRPA